MHNTVKFIVLFLGLILPFSPQLSFAVTAPQGVHVVLEELSELETSFEAGKWKEAQESVEKIGSSIREIFAQSKLTDETLEGAFADLRKDIYEENEKQIEVEYIRFQKQFFNFINQFDYDVHPILNIIQKYVMDESSEAYEKKDYEDVISEMIEAGNLIDHAKPLFMEKDVPEKEVDDFKVNVIKLIMAGKKNEYKQMGELLGRVKEQYASLMTQYKQK